MNSKDLIAFRRDDGIFGSPKQKEGSGLQGVGLGGSLACLDGSVSVWK